MKSKILSAVIYLILLCFTSSIHQASAEHYVERPTHWAYSTWLGTGIYELNQSEMFILSLSGDLALNDDPDLMYQLIGGLTIGLDKYGLRGMQLKVPEGVGSLQFTPGFQVTYRIDKRWVVKPFSQLGTGLSFVGGDTVYMVALGIKSIYSASLRTLKIDIGNQLMTARHVDGSLAPDRFGKFDTGVNIKLPYIFSLFNIPWDIHLFGMYTLFTSQIDELFSDHTSSTSPLSWIGQFGFDLGEAAEENQLRAGFRYVFGDDNLGGIRLNLGFPF